MQPKEFCDLERKLQKIVAISLWKECDRFIEETVSVQNTGAEGENNQEIKSTAELKVCTPPTQYKMAWPTMSHSGASTTMMPPW